MTALPLMMMTPTLTGTDTGETGYFLTGAGLVLAAIVLLVGAALLLRSRRLQ